ncbi:MAG: hypothetical protein ACRD0A_04615 [Acidimicrobiales bacterium]
MTLLVLFILAVIWLAVLLPPWLQNRGATRPADSITTFRNQLSVLERRAGSVAPHRVAARSPNVTTMYPYGASLRAGIGPAARPRPFIPAPVVRMSSADARQRRRDVVNTLGAAAVLTFVLAAFIGGPVWILNAVVLTLFGVYGVLMTRVQRTSEARETKVRYLPRRERAAEPAYLVRRSAN